MNATSNRAQAALLHARAERFDSRLEAALDRRSSLIDTLVVGVIFGALAFNIVLGSFTPVLMIAGVAAFALLRWERLYGMLASCWPLLTLPLLALVSAAWSQYPSYTIYYGILFLATVLGGIVSGAGVNRDSLLKGLFLALCLYTAMSVLFGRWVFWGEEVGGVAFAGLSGSKNTAGDLGALSVLAVAAMIIWAVSTRKLVWLALALPILPFALYILWGSRSTGALVAMGMALPCMVLWSVSRRLPLPVRTSVFVLALIVVAGFALAWSAWLPPLYDALLESTGKDVGLTGRAMIWRKADSLIAVRPILGTGYDAFWVHNNLDAEYLWRAMGISNRTGFNFHNTAREILVDLGFVGLAAFVLVWCAGLLALFVRTMIRPDFAAIFCCTLAVYFVPRMWFEVLGYFNIHHSTVIMFMILAYGFRPRTVPPTIAVRE